MEEINLKLAQKDIEEALKVVEDMEKFLEEKDTPKNAIRDKFIFLSEKVHQLENILKNEGII
jgi:hypothetical protein